MTTATERYFRARQHLGESHYVIPFEVLRAYLDEQALARRNYVDANGKAHLNNTMPGGGTITLTGQWLMSLTDHQRRELLRDLFATGDERSWAIQVAGQHRSTPTLPVQPNARRRRAMRNGASS